MSSTATAPAATLLTLCTAALVALGLGVRPVAGAEPALSDSAYARTHPSLLFAPAEVPVLAAKVRDGGADDAAYAFIRDRFQSFYRTASLDTLLDVDFGLAEIPNLGLAAFLESPPDSEALARGRDLTLHLAENYGVDSDPFYSSLRLRALALGYDLFFAAATEAQRAAVRDEAAAYVRRMLTDFAYSVWQYRPYVSNKTAMIASSLGLCAIGFHAELHPDTVTLALAAADRLYGAWREAHAEKGGANREGALYGLWSLRHLAYFFHARARYDSFPYADTIEIRNMERWLAYEIDPRGGARLNNIQDCTDYHLPLARHTTYFDWAQSAWGSRLSAFLWEQAAGAGGYDHGDEADKAGTVLWHRDDLVPQNPGELLPASMLWPERGLYYYRSGWLGNGGAEDVVFSFYSGEFRGGHAQEDQNQFTLAAYGDKLVVDHGAGSKSKQSEAHNLVLIDGAGQHNAGSSIGTDGRIATYILGGHADLVVGDAGAAYTTYSPYNAYGVPFPGTDWSWGYRGANPVERALRKVVVSHGDADRRPYFVVLDDVEKDDAAHAYQWRLHTDSTHAVSIAADPVQVAGANAVMDVRALYPPFDSLAVSVTPFNNFTFDPGSKVVSFDASGVAVRFAFLLMPRPLSASSPLVGTLPMPWGAVTSIVWGGATDLVLVNTQPAGTAMSLALDPYLDGGAGGGDPSAAPTVETDAEIAVVRIDGGAVGDYLFAGANWCTFGGVPEVTMLDAPASVSRDGDVVHIDREDADFAIHAAEVNEVRYRGARIPTIEEDGYLRPASVVGVRERPPGAWRVWVRAWPNPAAGDVRIGVALAERARATVDVFDVRGARVAVLHQGVLESGGHTLRWNGRNGAGRFVSSGVYFARVRALGQTRVVKVTVVR
jgi:hypothetical protein